MWFGKSVAGFTNCGGAQGYQEAVSVYRRNLDGEFQAQVAFGARAQEVAQREHEAASQAKQEISGLQSGS